jgi:predicted amidohydrolase
VSGLFFAEGALSGYRPEEADYLTRIDPAAIENAIGEIASVILEKRCYCLLGSATHRGDRWFNSVLFIDSSGTRSVYNKIHLAGLDLHHFTPGDALFFQVRDQAKFSTLACREVLFPHVWSTLKRQGAQIVFHLNNAIKPHDEVWAHLLVARAVENSIFVCSVNNANPPQALASYLIAPSGEILLQSEVQTEQVLTAKFDLNEVIPDLLARSDF